MVIDAKKPTAENMGLRPLSDRAIIRRDEPEEKTPGGLIIPKAAQDKPTKGRVLAVGPGRMLDNGRRAPMQVMAGDRVLLAAYGPETVKFGDEDLLLVREDQIFAIVKN